MALKILLADQFQLVAEAVAAYLSTQPDLSVRTAHTLPAARAHLSDDPGIALVLLDPKLPGMAGLPSVEDVIDQAPQAKVVLFADSLQRPFLTSALEAGCRGIILKSMPLNSLASVLGVIQTGQVFVPTDTAPPSEAEGKGLRPLTPDEAFVLRKAAYGLTNKEIARDMAATEVTVKMHMRTVCRKLGARNRAHAAMISRDLALL